MDRSQKAASVAALNAVFNEVGVVVVTRNLGLTVAQSTQLRTRMRDAGAAYKVAKNSLAKLAIANTDYEGIGEMLTGPTALATSVDPVAAAKAPGTGESVDREGGWAIRRQQGDHCSRAPGEISFPRLGWKLSSGRPGAPTVSDG